MVQVTEFLHLNAKAVAVFRSTKVELLTLNGFVGNFSSISGAAHLRLERAAPCGERDGDRRMRPGDRL